MLSDDSLEGFLTIWKQSRISHNAHSYAPGGNPSTRRDGGMHPYGGEEAGGGVAHERWKEETRKGEGRALSI